MCGVFVEVVGRHLVFRVINKVDTLEDILFYEAVALGHALTVLRLAVVHVDNSLWLSNVWNAHILFALRVILVSLGEDVQQGKVQPGTQYVRLAPGV